jgi:hypothetical protein
MKVIRPLAFWLLAVAVLASPACSHEPVQRGGLMLVIDQDGMLELDRFDVKVETSESVLLERTFHLGTEATLPATLGIVSNGQTEASVAIQVSGWKKKLPIDVRDLIVQQVPTTRIAELRVVLSGSCTSLVRAEDGKAISECPLEQTCDEARGACTSGVVDASTLADYDDGQGGAPSDLGGAPNLSGGSSGDDGEGSGGSPTITPLTGGKANLGGRADGAGGVTASGGEASGGRRSSGGAGGQAAGSGGVSSSGGATNLGSGGQPQIVCSTGSRFCQSNSAYSCSENGFTLVLEDTCDGNESCYQGACEVQTCVPLQRFCAAGEVHQCADNGLDHDPPIQTCSSSQYCDPASSTCLPHKCSPSESTCSNNFAKQCKADGSDFSSTRDCSALSQTCQAGACVGECAPQENRCNALQPQSCNASGAFENAGSACTGKASSNCSSVSGTCVSRAWALWPMPNPANSGLPHPANFTLSSGVAVDNVTGLEWQRDFSSTAFTTGSDEAKAYCSSLSTGGYSDWRLPSRIELLSLMDLPLGNRATAIDSIAFPLTPTGAFLTSSPLSGSISYYTVSFNLGKVATDVFSGRARCVRDSLSPAGSHYSAANGVVVDNWTQLSWQQAISSTKFTYNTAASYCQNLNLNGGGWRMPSFNELNTLVYEAGISVIDATAFPQTPVSESDYFWSSSLVTGDTSAYLVTFFEGQSKTATIATPQYLRCVR